MVAAGSFGWGIKTSFELELGCWGGVCKLLLRLLAFGGGTAVGCCIRCCPALGAREATTRLFTALGELGSFANGFGCGVGGSFHGSVGVLIAVGDWLGKDGGATR